MAYPRGTRARLIGSRQLVSGNEINNMNDALYSYQLLTALGTTQADAAKGDGASIEVASGSANNTGIVLPPALPGNDICILNNSANTTKIYGNGTDVIQTTGTTYAAAATGITMATLVAIRLHCIKAGFWQRIITA